MIVSARETVPEGELRERKTGEEYGLWVDKLRAETYIERKGHFADAAMLGSQSGYARESKEEDSRF